MNTTSTVIRAGIVRGLIEYRIAFSGAGLIGQLFWPVATLIAIMFLRDLPIPGTTLALGASILPSTLGMFVAFGMLLVVQQLATDREDGTLLRAKATPGGIRGYLIGKLTAVSLTVLTYLLILLIPGSFIVSGLDVDRPGSWATFAWVLGLGLVASLTIGAVLGSLITTARGAGYISLLIMGLVAISGIFFPITESPSWLQWIGQAFPIYWLGLGMRSVLLPDTAAAIEIGDSWRHLETAAVLGAWAVVGLIVAPVLLSRMARRESGSRLANRQQKALQQQW